MPADTPVFGRKQVANALGAPPQLPHQRQQIVGQHDIAILFAFAKLNPNLLAIEIEVRPLQTGDLRDSQTGCIQHGEKQLVTQRASGLHHPLDLFLGHHDRQSLWLSRGHQSNRATQQTEFVQAGSQCRQSDADLRRRRAAIDQQFQVLPNIFLVDQVQRSSVPAKEADPSGAIVFDGVDGVKSDPQLADQTFNNQRLGRLSREVDDGMLRFEFRLHSVSRGVSAASVSPRLAVGVETRCIRCDKTRHELLQQIRRRHVSQTFSEPSVTNNANPFQSGYFSEQRMAGQSPKARSVAESTTEC
ncbi:hypothetical protein RE6C_04341 [Rhodopirellula europaea 6C]|uniref:Uncharacterized protein n=1 Tax=Rhodopirellula europaea 6C TaxID=1263867 RepID=M2AYF9_9BACT|nr:hypothetical protein RE6C_04341 [Rhodopirellula europaea 6C]